MFYSPNSICGLRGASSFEKPVGIAKHAKSRYSLSCIIINTLFQYVAFCFSLNVLAGIAASVPRDAFVPYLSSNIPLNLYSYFQSQEHITRSLINCISDQDDYMTLTVKCTMQAYSIRPNQEYHDSENSQCKLESGARLCLWCCADFFWMGHRDLSEGIVLAISLHGIQCLYSKHDFEMIYWQKLSYYVKCIIHTDSYSIRGPLFRDLSPEENLQVQDLSVILSCFRHIYHISSNVVRLPCTDRSPIHESLSIRNTGGGLPLLDDGVSSSLIFSAIELA